MSATFDVAVIGATGTVGETLVQVLEERDFPLGQLHVLASEASVAQSIPFRGRNVRVKSLNGFDFNQVKLVFFCAGDAVTAAFAGQASEAGCQVIDLAGGAGAPAVVPEVNAQTLQGLSAPSRVGTPGSIATALALALAPLQGLLDIEHVTVTACLPMSASSREAVRELARQTTELLNARPLEPRVFDRQVAFNMLAQVGEPDAAGQLALEKRAHRELRELLNLPLLKVSISCIQAPVFFGDSLTVSVRSRTPVDVQAATQALEQAAGVEWTGADDYPTVVGDAVGQDVVYVGRVRGGLGDPCELNLWLVLDNVRKGAALNAVQVAELLIKRLS
ncbi:MULTISPECIES: aspartate-semialdehyde dehydrogenase [Pseudomonas]|uniref:Aspartate-semialdehyde dehydrogenase n=1 Tax=Pseudomonas quercus TaxID=2722792 RepID=A0ABX0YCE7_9PSED|nr:MULTISPECIES: aspartate-semialdehyde dehydrogenase [Pseudomonas]MBF7141367.1 aspartate-semialdehyde dehydrogenase [Pseudomonas sp. LY10J]NJO99905.1 aspartate-semialdehyde dehydrogenase [Pseudomonas quercus]